MLIMMTTVAAFCSYPERLYQLVNNLRTMIRSRKMSYSSHLEKPPKGRLRIYSTTCLLVGQGIVDRLVPSSSTAPKRSNPGAKHTSGANPAIETS